jgi:hypothetical protein
LVESDLHDLTALDPADERSFHVAVAGPAALFVAKVHKIAERIDQPDRLVEKDALDVLRLLRAIPTNTMAVGLRRLAATETAGEVTGEAIELAGTLLANADAPGAQMAARAAGDLEDPLTVAMSLAALAGDLITDYHRLE